MGKIIKIISLILVAMITVVFLSSAIAVGAKAADYMNRQNFNFGDAVKWALEDYRDWLNSIGHENTNNILEFEFTNKKIDVVPCVSL